MANPILSALALALLASAPRASAPGGSAPRAPTPDATPPATFTIPFDFSRSAIGLTVSVSNHPLYMLLDTGVDPSVIDLSRAQSLSLPIDRQHGSSPTGFGNGKGSTIYPTTLRGLSIANHPFAPFPALASDLSALSTHYGRPLDGILGYSFLVHQTLLIDYPHHTLTLLATPADSTPLTHSCRTHSTTPLHTLDGFPVIPSFRFGSAHAPITIDTGSNGTLALFQSALTLPGLRPALVPQGIAHLQGARGASQATTYTLQLPIGFGPFTLPAGSTVTLRQSPGTPHTRVANAGNTLLAALQLKVLLDYRHKALSFYGNCN